MLLPGKEQKGFVDNVEQKRLLLGKKLHFYQKVIALRNIGIVSDTKFHKWCTNIFCVALSKVRVFENLAKSSIIAINSWKMCMKPIGKLAIPI